MIEDQYFASAIKFDIHPMKNTKKTIKAQYYCALKYFADHIGDSEHIRCRLTQYKLFLLQEDQKKQEEKSSINAIISCKRRPWRNKYKFWLICDLALIVNNLTLLNKGTDQIKTFVSEKQKKQIDDLLEILSNPKAETTNTYFALAQDLIDQYRKNDAFLSAKERRVIVTANMSAGKSTLINAVTGKNIARTSQEVCTGNICYFYNKAFDDGKIHFNTNKLSYSSSENEFKDLGWDSPAAIALPFGKTAVSQNRLCIIDTPGVNAAIKREHGRITKKCIAEEKYDLLLYILNANKLGTDEEIAYLNWISKTVPSEKIIFVLNKLDDFRTMDDSISASIEGIKKDLIKFGHTDPIIYPISAYFAYLIKRRSYGETISEDEEDEYILFTKKFSKPKYDLSQFYGEKEDAGNDLEGMLKRSGVYYLEKMLYGGIS